MTTGMQPYRPPVTPPRGWRVGPIQIPLSPAVSTADGLPAALTVDQSVVMDLATATGDGLAGDVSLATVVDSNTSMLLADGSGGDGLSANVTVDSSTAMDLADGSGGTALVPTVSIVNPITFGAVGGGQEPSVNPNTTITATWSHTKLTADNCAVVAVCGNTTQQRSAFGSVTATYGGAAMTSLGASSSYFYSANNTYSWVEWFYKLSPAAGAQTVAATATGSSQFMFISCNSLTYSNVTSVSGFVSNGSTGSTGITQTVSSAVNRRVVAASSCYGNVGITTQTVRDTSGGGQRRIADAAGAASVTFAGGTPTAAWATAAIQLL